MGTAGAAAAAGDAGVLKTIEETAHNLGKVLSTTAKKLVKTIASLCQPLQLCFFFDSGQNRYLQAKKKKKIPLKNHELEVQKMS